MKYEPDTKFIKERMGHADIKTTMWYLHGTKRDLNKIKSPLDDMDFWIKEIGFSYKNKFEGYAPIMISYLPNATHIMHLMVHDLTIFAPLGAWYG